ncbi:AMP-binding protein [Flagellimonas lutaonensis]|uniref:AMP-dependent synthetase n=1 Tax=Flagellimonas lutaonensis TaxID=516051 RepID=A0A0D5YVY8_9FLAO|nr:AMP-binding protein [Allomuricauda lutaonensis]AKA36066.1 AMP-dependent synthetase [Allomuricauda lutaonensis]
MGLLEHMAKNDHLVFLDADSGKKRTLQEMLFPMEEIGRMGKKLVFLYLNSDIVSTATYLSFLDTQHATVLLSDALEPILKENLESEYEPSIIFDASRDHIKGYEKGKLANEWSEITLFIDTGKETKVHLKCKVLLSTSGTTGSPKFVKLSEDNLLENAKSICAYLPIVGHDVTPLNLPLYYSYGLSVLHTNAIAGGTVVSGVADILQRDFWNQMDRHGFTSIAGVPYIYEMLNRIGFLKKNYPSLRYISQAGGNLSQNIKKNFNDYCKKNDIAFYVMYGQTEASARISYVPAELLEEKITSIGTPIKNGELSLDPETDELLYKGPNVFGGYSEKREDLETWQKIDPLRTGDLAYQDEDGFYYIKGRLKRFVKIFGNRVNLDELERFLKTTFNIGLVACVGVKDQFILVSHCENTISDDDIKKNLFERFKIHQASIKVKHLKEMPLTSNGKVDYKKITATSD